MSLPVGSSKLKVKALFKKMMSLVATVPDPLARERHFATHPDLEYGGFFAPSLVLANAMDMAAEVSCRIFSSCLGPGREHMAHWLNTVHMLIVGADNTDNDKAQPNAFNCIDYEAYIIFKRFVYCQYILFLLR